MGLQTSIDQAVINFRAELERTSKAFPEESLGQVLNDPSFAKKHVAVLSASVEVLTNMVSRTVTVDPTLSGEDAVANTSDNIGVTESVVSEMPRVGEGGEVTLHYVELRTDKSPSQLLAWVQKKYPEYRVADPYEICAHMREDPLFSEKHPCRTVWINRHGAPCLASFFVCGEESYTYIQEDDSDGCWSHYLALVRL